MMKAAWPILASFILFDFASQAAFLKGVVVENSSNHALARVKVTLSWTGQTSGSSSVLTDSTGQFLFSDLGPGSYLLEAVRKGYMRTKFGQRDWNLPGTPIILDATGSYAAEMRMRKLGVVSGEVVDENHVGIPDLAVYAYRVAPRLKLEASSVTDDRGAFRISGLPPGKYYVRTGPHEMEDRHGMLPTYFGQTAKIADAKISHVRLEEEAGGLVIEPIPGRLSTLSGILNSPAPANVVLITDMGRRDMHVEPGGPFHFDQLAPGAYELMAETAVSGVPYAAYKKLYIGKDSEIANLELSRSPELEIRCEEQGGSKPSAQAVSVFIRRKNQADEIPRQLQCSSRTAVGPGEWEIAALPSGAYYVTQIGNTRIIDGTYQLVVGASEFKRVNVVLSGTPGSVSGVIKTSDGQSAVGAPVYLNPLDDELRSRIGGVRVGRADSDGKFRMDGLPPGRYEALSTFQVSDPAEADWTPGRGRALVLSEGEETKVDLTVLD